MGKNDKVEYGEMVWPKLSLLHRQALCWIKFYLASTISAKTLKIMDEAYQHPSILRIAERLEVKVPLILLTKETSRSTYQGYIPYTHDEPLGLAIYPNSIHSWLLSEVPTNNGERFIRSKVKASDFTVWSVARELMAHMFRAYLDRLVLVNENSPFFSKGRGGYRNSESNLHILDTRGFYRSPSPFDLRTILAKKAYESPNSENVIRTLHTIAEAWKKEKEEQSYDSIVSGDSGDWWCLDEKGDILTVDRKIRRGEEADINLCQSGKEFLILSGEETLSKRLVYRSDNLLLATEEFISLDKRKNKENVTACW